MHITTLRRSLRAPEPKVRRKTACLIVMVGEIYSVAEIAFSTEKILVIMPKVFEKTKVCVSVVGVLGFSFLSIL